MKLSFALSLLLILFAGGVWGEEDEFPMKLTCEWGADILYVYVAEDIYKSWFQFHPSSSSYHVKKNGYERLPVRCGKRERAKKELCSVDKDNIKLHRLAPLGVVYLKLNRRTMKNSRGGQCFKGFKEYK